MWDTADGALDPWSCFSFIGFYYESRKVSNITKMTYKSPKSQMGLIDKKNSNVFYVNFYPVYKKWFANLDILTLLVRWTTLLLDSW